MRDYADSIKPSAMRVQGGSPVIAGAFRSGPASASVQATTIADQLGFGRRQGCGLRKQGCRCRFHYWFRRWPKRVGWLANTPASYALRETIVASE